jgi:hypothetical protein
MSIALELAGKGVIGGTIGYSCRCPCCCGRLPLMSGRCAHDWRGLLHLLLRGRLLHGLELLRWLLLLEPGGLHCHWSLRDILTRNGRDGRNTILTLKQRLSLESAGSKVTRHLGLLLAWRRLLLKRWLLRLGIACLLRLLITRLEACRLRAHVAVHRRDVSGDHKSGLSRSPG